MKKVLVVSTSLRNESNSDTLAIAFLRGAREVGNETEYVTLQDKTISFCKGCNACQHGHKPCVIKDDAVEIAEKIKNADVVAFATPIYFYEMAGQMKTMLDRCYPSMQWVITLKMFILSLHQHHPKKKQWKAL